MPPRSKHPRRSGPSASTVNSMATSTASTSSSLSNSTSNQQDGTMQVNVTALSSALSPAVQKAVRDSLQPPPSVTTSTNAASTSTAVSTHVPTTASIVQNSVVQVTQAIAGTSGGNIVSPNVHNMPPTPLFSSVAILLGSAVSDKLKSKIWANEFVHPKQPKTFLLPIKKIHYPLKEASLKKFNLGTLKAISNPFPEGPLMALMPTFHMNFYPPT